MIRAAKKLFKALLHPAISMVRECCFFALTFVFQIDILCHRKTMSQFSVQYSQAINPKILIYVSKPLS